MSFPRYPTYKDSGVEWLGEVPEHWKIVPAKYHIRSAAGGTSIKGNCADEPSEGFFPGFSASGQDVWLEAYDHQTPGIVLSAVGARCGKTFKADGFWGVVANTHCLFPREADRNFIWYLTNIDNWWEKGGSAQPFIKVGETLVRKWVFPPFPEQTRIAAFLDRETAKIDGLVAEQQRLIDLLKEKRQAVISHAVTKGLNPAAPMKPSGIEWLGDVPAHWKILPVKAVCKLFGRIGYRGYTTEDIVDVGDGAITLSPSNMIDGEVVTEKSAYISWEKYNESPEIMVAGGDIVMVKTGSTYGKVAHVGDLDHPATINPQLVLFKQIVINRRYLFRTLQSSVIQAMIENNNSGSTIPTMSQENIGNFKLSLPPESEQREISQFIDREVLHLNALTAESQRAIALLQERRTALISAAVTGQIDVRHLAEAGAA